MRCATTSASTIRISAAGSRNAAPAPCISTASRSAPASRRSRQSADGKVVTLAGLGTPEKPHPLQTAYVEEQVPQCGYCINGWIMTAAALLNENKKPTEAEIKDALDRPQVPLRHAYGHHARGQARRRDDGLREAIMTKMEKAAQFSRRSILKAGGALVVSVGTPIGLDTVLGISAAFAQGAPSRRSRRTSSPPTSPSTPTAPSPPSSARWTWARACSSPSARWWRKSSTCRSRPSP